MESFLWYYINITQKDGHTVNEQQKSFRNSDNKELKAKITTVFFIVVLLTVIVKSYIIKVIIKEGKNFAVLDIFFMGYL
jgi:hypothetical protein